MARYGYDDVAGYGRAWRGGRRRSRGRRFDPDAEYANDFGEFLPMGAVDEVQEQMGMRDFSERYGRYSGGSPYAYEYSERTILHRPEYYGPRGFSRPLGEDRYLRGRRLPPSSPERSRPAVPRERRRR